jgi:hypothetical protein
MALLYKVRILLSLLIFISLNVNARDTFEQAYAPIMVGDITIFIPIELTPEPAKYLTLKNTDNQSLLEWSPLIGVTHYMLEHKVNGIWKTLNDNVLTNSYSTSIYDGPEFRVSSCHKYGCSVSQSINNRINVSTQIRGFQATSYQVKNSDTVNVVWDVVGASIIKLQSSKGVTYENLPPRSSLRVSTNDLTTFTLTASGFGSIATQQLSIVKPVPTPNVKVPMSSVYLQPLYDLGLQPIERSLLLGKNNNNYVADMQKQLHRVTDSGQIIWTQSLPGLIANKPIYLFDNNNDAFLFFTLSKSSLIHTQSAGQFCRLNVNVKALHCFNLEHNAIASPAVYMEPGIIRSTPRVFVVDVKGNLHEFSAFEASGLKLISSQQLLLNQNEIRVLTTPQISAGNKQIIVRTETNQVIAYPLPTAETLLSKSINAISALLSVESTSPNEQPTQTSATWSRKLN